tara:strand:- start:3271 stop:5004 length:1734 start_codon:yes stop_codon:yes gene_type:complete
MSTARKNLPQRLLHHTVSQDYSIYTNIDQAVWRYIMKISYPFFKNNAHEKYVDGLDLMGISINEIPLVDDMDKKLDNYNWGAVAVKGFIPPIVFMEFLSKKVLPIAVDMRTHHHINYTPAPDIVHESSGHAPIIADPDYAEYLSAYGEISRYAIESKYDSELYNLIREMSDIKENPNSKTEDLEKIEKRFEKMSKKNVWLSEAAELARMNWWTIEYGLVGDLNNPKIYGAGLLSSVSESNDCLKSKVKKIPISIDCIKTGYNITEPQPQLFVTKNFKELKKILNEYKKTMAYVNGGEDGLNKAILSKNITTSVYNSGLQVSGILDKFIRDNNDKITYLQFIGNVQLSNNHIEIEGHGKGKHPQGYGGALGVLSDIGLPLHQLDSIQLKQIGLIKNKNTKLKFEGGLTVEGRVDNILKIKNTPILISLVECEVHLNNKILYKPEWGTYDLSCGNKIVSVFGGPADWNKFYNYKPPLEKSIHQSSNLNADTKELNTLYGEVKKLIINNAKNDNYIPILEKLYTDYPEDWLLCMEIYEKIYNDNLLENEVKQLRAHINKFSEEKHMADTIKRGLSIIEKN